MDALAKARSRTKAIVESAMDGIVTFSRHNLIITTMNPAARVMFGAEVTAVLQEPITNFIELVPAASSHASVTQFLQEIVQANDSYEVQGRRLDGSTFPVEISIQEADMGDEVQYIGVFHDITRRKETQAALEQSEHQYRTLVNNMHDGVFMVQGGTHHFCQPVHVSYCRL